MKQFVLAAALMSAGPAFAQQDSLTLTRPMTPAESAARAMAPQRYNEMGQQAVMGGTAYSVERTPLGLLANDPRARRILDEELPGLLDHASFREISGNPLARIIPPGQMAMSPQKLQTIQARLDAIR